MIEWYRCSRMLVGTCFKLGDGLLAFPLSWNTFDVSHFCDNLSEPTEQEMLFLRSIDLIPPVTGWDAILIVEHPRSLNGVPNFRKLIRHGDLTVTPA